MFDLFYPKVVTILAIGICLLVIVLQYIWLSVLAYRQEAHVRKYDNAAIKIDEKLELILFAPTLASMNSEIEALGKFVGKDPIKMDTLSTRTLALLTSDQSDSRQKAAVVAVNDRLKPLDFYIKMLRNGDSYEKAYACRKAAVYYAESELPTIRRLSKSKNRELAYNAAMALSIFGDEETLVEIIQSYEQNYDYSYRIILELMSFYTGDLVSLASKVFQNCDEYIKTIVIKGLSDYMLSEFETVYLQGLMSKNPNLKAACIRALGKIGKPEYEHKLIVAAHDINWVVRSAAVKALKKMNSDRVKKTLVEATRDTEWWVRYNAAKSLVRIDSDLTYVESVLEGYDKYGSDAVKYVLYRGYSMSVAN
mgnify:FL=1